MSLTDHLAKYRINKDEYDKICSLLGRPPEGVEWALFSALWSEHCSYKSSKVHLKKIFSESPRVVQSFGENAGVIDLGEGERVAFKMESHNHPSFIEPYQGAATGVGGILRDIFTMGARPVALANYLCFGDPKADRMEKLVDGVVRGISGYGNCVGVPMLSGKTQFNKAYNGNILVNALAIGYFGPGEEVVTSKAHGEGNYVVYAGAKTGRDGVHGASMASESFDEGSEDKRPTVQIGDPFYEKLLIEASLEVIQRGLVAAVQDMGAAGLTSSSFEMASKGQVGLKIDLGKVPLRDPSMEAEDLLLSESQERMLFIVEPQKWKDFKEVFDRWDLECSIIGEVISERKIHLTFKGEVLTVIDPDLVVESAPSYQRDVQLKERHFFPEYNDLKTFSEVLSLLGSPQFMSREWIYQQYDQRVGANTVRDCSYDVGSLCLPHSSRALGLTLGGRIEILEKDAFLGGWDSIFYPALQLSGLGFLPLAVTDCLNFGNPEKPEIMGQFVQSLDGMNLACKTLEAPIISGNVSFYNETQGQNVVPTPSTGVVGLCPHLKLPEENFAESGHRVYLLDFAPELVPGKAWSESEIKDLASTLGQNLGILRERSQNFEFEGFRAVGLGGVLWTLFQMSLTNQLGFRMTLSPDDFSKGLYRAIVVLGPDQVNPSEWSWASKVSVQALGSTGGSDLVGLDGDVVSLNDALEAKRSSWGEVFNGLA